LTLNLSDNPPACSPGNLFETGLGPDKPWWVARTKSRQEKALAWDLGGAKINYYLPMIIRPQKNRVRLRMALVPLFNGYLFFQGDGLERYAALKTGRVAQAIAVTDQSTLHEELRNIALALLAQEKVELCQYLHKGQRARILYGPLTGIEGVVENGKGKARLILRVQAINQAVRIEIDLDQVQPL
jgi:transcription antitermination factor NusG